MKTTCSIPLCPSIPLFYLLEVLLFPTQHNAQQTDTKQFAGYNSRIFKFRRPEFEKHVKICNSTPHFLNQTQRRSFHQSGYPQCENLITVVPYCHIMSPIFSCLGSVALPVRVTLHESMTIVCLSQLFYANKSP